MKVQITIFAIEYTFDVAILGLTIVAMLIVWYAHRKWHGRGYATAFAAFMVFAGGSWLLYKHLLDVIVGRIQTPRMFIFCSEGVARCKTTYFRNADPDAFWLTVTFWTLFDIAAITASALVLYKLWRTRQNRLSAAQEQNPRKPWWFAAMVCVVGLLAWLFAAEREAERQGFSWRDEAKPEPLQLRVDPGANR